MDVDKTKSVSNTLILLGTVWITVGLLPGTLFLGRELGLGIAVGGILPLVLGIGLYSKTRQKE